MYSVPPWITISTMTTTHIRNLTEHGPRNLRPCTCMTAENMELVTDREHISGGVVRAQGRTWKWSPIQRVWVEA